ncbi:tripartite motif-containing protein 16-like [Ctenopharyngodon idella]|uniref:tripartite motif-containing protein 16-like n=1 Tax=Ctenopharyngodon idella TaxID=7959 RepID=UPI00222F9DA0|nr:tripartite motif-containing protein 16-like [Ctenopharyngodon idella]
MAETGFSQEQFSCPVCLDLLKDPVAIPCGHNFCKSCIIGYWNLENQKGVYSCPQCRQTFTSRPALNKNTLLAEVVEQLKKTKLQAAVPAECEDVECDVCTGRKHKAVKSCLVCLNSYCQNHLQQHDSLFKGKRHHLIDATGRLQEMICPEHNKQLEIYCHTDEKCICFLCTMDNHKNHDTVRAVAERTKKQMILKERQRMFQQRIQQREKDLEELRVVVESHKRSADTAVEDSERIFIELLRSIENICSKVTQRIREQEKSAVSRAEGFMDRLEQEIDDLKRRDAELELLSCTHDHIHFLKSFQSLSEPPESTDVPSVTVSSLLTFDDVGKYVFQLKEKLEDFCREEIDKISGRVTYIEIIPTNEPKIREEFLQYSSPFTLDPNTVNEHLRLSVWNRMFNVPNVVQQYPDHPERFDNYPQVLCRESVCGRCYWELEWNGDDGVEISVSYKSISRRGGRNECVFGCNDQSWSLDCSPFIYSFWHNNSYTDLPVPPSRCRIGVYVDHKAGSLSFYSVSDTMTLIHRVQTTFTQPLYPGFAVHGGSTVKLCDLTQ